MLLPLLFISLSLLPSPSLSSSPASQHAVVIPYTSLLSAFASPDSSTFSKISAAYGPSGLGILAVSGVPDLDLLRHRLLPLAREIALLPESDRKGMERPEAFFQVGWSHGNEKLQGDVPDFAKGSFYANPLVDVPLPSDSYSVSKYPSFLSPNAWPDESLPSLEGSFKALGRLAVEVGVLVAKQCDDYVETVVEGYEKGKLRRLLETSTAAKGRLLHYYPVDVDVVDSLPSTSSDDDGAFGDWCGWHQDHGSLTALVPALHFAADGSPVPNPDPSSGLYVQSRSGDLIKVSFPPGLTDVLLFQIGETSQVHTGGALSATPHAVRSARGAEAVGVSRETFAVFMEPEYDGDMKVPLGRSAKDVQDGDAVRFLPDGVRTLESRWKEGMDFGEFSEETFRAFY